MAITLSSTGQLEEARTRENFAIGSVVPEDGFPDLTFLALSMNDINNSTNFTQVDFMEGSLNSNGSNLASVFINSQLSALFQTQANPSEELRPLVFTFFEVGSPFFEDGNLTNFEVGSLILSVVVNTGEIGNVTFENFSSPIEFKFQVTEVRTYVSCCVGNVHVKLLFCRVWSSLEANVSSSTSTLMV